MKRKIITIDEEKCNGCGVCIPNCHEGALQIINGKARLISDYMCDGLGACLGHCPEGAISIEEKEAEPYNEKKVMASLSITDRETIDAHLKHMLEHKEYQFLMDGISVLTELPGLFPFTVSDLVQKYTVLLESHQRPQANGHQKRSGCPGSSSFTIDTAASCCSVSVAQEESALTHWPVQLHLINPASSHFKNSDLLISADCVAYAMAGFHSKHLKGKTLAIACPKLDSGLDIYLNKITQLIQQAEIKSITILQMEVPCCNGLTKMVLTAMNQSGKQIPIDISVVGFNGDILSQQRIEKETTTI